MTRPVVTLRCTVCGDTILVKGSVFCVDLSSCLAGTCHGTIGEGGGHRVRCWWEKFRGCLRYLLQGTYFRSCEIGYGRRSTEEKMVLEGLR